MLSYFIYFIHKKVSVWIRSLLISIISILVFLKKIMLLVNPYLQELNHFQKSFLKMFVLIYLHLLINFIILVINIPMTFSLSMVLIPIFE